MNKTQRSCEVKGKDVIKYIVDNNLEECDVSVIKYENNFIKLGDYIYDKLRFEESNDDLILIRVEEQNNRRV